MELLCLFCPEIIGICVFLKLYPQYKKNKLNILLYYFLNVLIINFIILLISKTVFNTYLYIFTVDFSIKYIMLSSFISIAIPFIIYYIPSKLKKSSFYINVYNDIKKGIIQNKNKIFIVILILSFF